MEDRQRDDAFEWLLAGDTADAGAPDLTAFVTGLRSMAQAPSETLAARHLAAMAGAAASLEQGRGLAGRRAPRRLGWVTGRRWAAAMGLAGALTLTGGLAAAGALPAPAQNAISTVARDVGIDLPRSPQPERPAVVPVFPGSNVPAGTSVTTGPGGSRSGSDRRCDGQSDGESCTTQTTTGGHHHGQGGHDGQGDGQGGHGDEVGHGTPTSGPHDATPTTHPRPGNEGPNQGGGQGEGR